MKAFPVTSDNYTSQYSEDGMDLRDYFAAKAMQGSISHGGFRDDESLFAKWCYETADAMMEARNESK